MKNQLISEITRQMLPFLDNAQMEHLQEVLHHTLWNVQITVPEGAVQEPEKESNEELLNMFLSSKRVEGCSEKTLRYYETSIRRLFSALDIHVTHMQTDDLRTYLSEYQQQSQCSKSNIDNIRRILSSVLMEFPIKEIKANIPRWILSLEQGHWLKDALYQAICEACGEIYRINHVSERLQQLEACDYISRVQVTGMDLGHGKVMLSITVQPNLFYDILSEATGLEIGGEEGLLPCLCQLAQIKKEYDKVRGALEEVSATGYGIVMPSLEELSLEEPQIVKQGGRYGVRLKASAPSIHMMRADITTEVSPIVGSEKQSEELVMSLLQEFEDDPQKIWSSNIFGKSLHELVNEGLHNKLYRMPSDARIRMQETIERIINEGCNGLICIIL